MTEVFTALSISLDGFIAGADDGLDQPLGTGGSALFEWFSSGDTPSRHYPNFRMTPVSARVFESTADRAGAVITGRRTYDIARGWGGAGPLPGVPLFVLTHHAPDQVPAGDPPYTIVTDGLESAVTQARRAGGDKDVSLMGAHAVQQCLRAGLLDELILHVTPVLLGAGVRLLDNVGEHGASLECIGVVDAPGVTHLSYRVHR